jgi:hypothetical protein
VPFHENLPPLPSHRSGVPVYKLPDSSTAKLTFRSSKELYLKGKDSFYSNVVNFLKKTLSHSNCEPVDLEKIITDTKINVIIDIIQNNYISEWKQQINNSSKLSFYSRFKKNYKLEDYILNIIKDPSKRRIFTQNFESVIINYWSNMIGTNKYHVKKDFVDTVTVVQLKTNFTLPLNVINTTI